MILVTGSTGFVGSEILTRASQRGWRVRGLARNPERSKALGRLPYVELFRGDVGDPGTLGEAFEDISAVIHLVGIIVPTRTQDFTRVHIEGTRNVLELAQRAGVDRYVHMSALGVETGRGLSEYYRTKWAAEERVRRADLSTTIFRPSLILGPGGELYDQLSRAIRWSPVVPLPASNARFQPVWVGDVAESMLQAARMPSAPREAYDVAGPDIMTLPELTALLARAMGRSRPTVAIPLSVLKLGAGLAEAAFPKPPVTRDQLKMLSVDNVSDPESIRALVRDFEIEHASLAVKAADWFKDERNQA